MKNVYEVLRLKEQQLEKVKREVECLKIAAPLLADAADDDQDLLSMGAAAGANGGGNGKPKTTPPDQMKRWP